MRMHKIGAAFTFLIAAVAVSQLANSDDRLGRVTTVGVPAGGRPVVARAGADGTIHLLFDSDRGPQYARSTDNGESFHSIIPVVAGEPGPPGLEYSAWDMAVGKRGSVHVAVGTNAW